MEAKGIIWVTTVPAEPVSLAYPRRTLLVLAGPPGAGKTTFARRLLTGPRLEIDVIAREPDRAGRPIGFAVAARLILERALSLSLSADQVIVDSTAVNPAYREDLCRVALAAGLEPHLLGVDATLAECESGLASRPRSPFAPMPFDVLLHYDESWRRLKELAATGQISAEGWASVVIIDRVCATRLTAIHFG